MPGHVQEDAPRVQAEPAASGDQELAQHALRARSYISEIEEMDFKERMVYVVESIDEEAHSAGLS